MTQAYPEAAATAILLLGGRVSRLRVTAVETHEKPASGC